MEHAGIPAHTRQVIMSLHHANPTSIVRDSSQKSTQKTQTKEFRQGCPLSPYLFGLVLTHFLLDVGQSYQAQYGEISGIFHVLSPFWDLEYADVTVLLSCSAIQLNRLLHLIQHHGSNRGRILIHDKFEHLRLHSSHHKNYSPSLSCTCDCPFGSGHNHDVDAVSLFEEVL